MKPSKPDNRPRFGWANMLDDNPQMIFEEKPSKLFIPKYFPVVVIPLPYQSAKVRKKIREFVNGTLWPKSK